MTHIHRQHLTVVARHSASVQRFHEPFRNHSLWELALRVFEAENRPASSRIQQPLQLKLVVFC